MWKVSHNTKLAEQLINKTPDFSSVMILPTMICDCRCEMCRFWGDSGYYFNGTSDVSKKQLDFKSITRFIEEALKEKKRFSVVLSGGEPLLYNNFTPLVQFLKKKRLPTSIVSNGSQLKNHLDTVMQNVTAIAISIDGPPDVHDSIRRKKGLFNDALEGIEALIRIKMKTKMSTPFIFINCTLGEHSVNHLHDFIAAVQSRLEPVGAKLCLERPKTLSYREVTVQFGLLVYLTEELGKKYTDEMKSLFDCNVTDLWKSLVVDTINIDAEKLKKDLHNIYNDFNVDTSDFFDVKEYFDTIYNVFGYTHCQAPFNMMIINDEGDSYFCPGYPDYLLGNISNDSFHDIWHGANAERFRNVIKKRNLSICNRCCFRFMDYSINRHILFYDTIIAKMYYWFINRVPTFSG